MAKVCPLGKKRLGRSGIAVGTYEYMLIEMGSVMKEMEGKLGGSRWLGFYSNIWRDVDPEKKGFGVTNSKTLQRVKCGAFYSGKSILFLASDVVECLSLFPTLSDNLPLRTFRRG